MALKALNILGTDLNKSAYDFTNHDIKSSSAMTCLHILHYPPSPPSPACATPSFQDAKAYMIG